MIFRHKGRIIEPVSRQRWLELNLIDTIQRTLIDQLPWLMKYTRRPFVEVEGDSTIVYLPATKHITREQRAMIKEVVGDRRGVVQQMTWSAVGTTQRVELVPRPIAPSAVKWGECIEWVKAASNTGPLIGVTYGNQPIYVDYNSDSPHILISAGSGGGKSVISKLIVAQGLHLGGKAVFLDYKRRSHTWAVGLPGVTYCRTIPEIHQALITLGDIGEQRNVLADDPDADIGPRIFIVVEEMNATMFKLNQYWEQIRDKSDPKKSPAVTALADLVYMGRASLMNVIAIAQMMTARTMGGPEVRENFGTRLLTRFSPQAFRMLAPDVAMPAREFPLGRWFAVIGGNCVLVQSPYLDDHVAREWVNETQAIMGSDLGLGTDHVAELA